MDYKLEIGVIIYNSSNEDFVVHKGDRIAQGILCKYNVMDEDNVVDEDRDGGFGSTGV